MGHNLSQQAGQGFAAMFTAGFTIGLAVPAGLAQITPDATLPVNSIATPNGGPNGGTTTITGGTQAGSTLFHSFQQFSLPTGQEAFFSNGANVGAIVTRVTGNSVSSIDGRIRASGAASLYFLNPNGIVFGPNASIRIGGSFLATTADRFLFANGDFFSASSPQSTPLLAVNLPVGLQMGSQTATILNRSLALNGAGSLPGLAVQPGNALGLVGGNVELQRGEISARAGHVEIGSLAPNSQVAIQPAAAGFSLNYDAANAFQDINLSQGSLVDISGGGSLQVAGRNISLRDGSLIDANTLGAEAGGSVNLRATGQLGLLGTSIDGNTSSRITANVLVGATGRGSDVAIAADSLRLDGGAQIGVKTFGAGNAGSLAIQAKQIAVVGQSDNGQLQSSISTEAATGSMGRGGDLRIVSDRLQTRNGGEIRTSTDGAGNAGNLSIRANQVDLIGGNLNFPQSGLFTNAYSNATGNGGNFDLTVAGKLTLLNGGKIKTETLGAGNAGNLAIQAQQMDVIGLLTADSVSFVSSTVRGEQSTGQGGNLAIAVDQLRVIDGGQIAAGTYGLGNAGNLTIQANAVEVGGAPATATNAGGIFTGPVSRSRGAGGDLAITANTLRVRDGGIISAGTGGSGNSGRLTIQAQLLDVRGSSASGRTVSAVSTSVGTTGSGHGNDLQINSDRIVLREGGQITAGTFGQGNAGALVINTDQLDIAGVSASGRFSSGLYTAVAAAAATGQGGEIRVAANQVQVLDGGRISASTQGLGDAGNISITANRLDVAGVSAVGNRTSSITAGASSTQPTQRLGAAGSIGLNVQNLTVRDRALVTVSSGNNSHGAGDLDITAGRVLLDNGGGLQANAGAGTQGNIDIQSQIVTLRRGSSISTNAQGQSAGGNIAIATDYLVAVFLENSDITANAVNNFGGNVRITAKGIFGTQVRPQLTPESDITASSDRGAQFSGQVIVNTPNLNPNQEITKLAEMPIDPHTQITTACSRTAGDPTANQFVETGRGGLPDNAQQPAAGPASWADLRTVAVPEVAAREWSRSQSQPDRSPQSHSPQEPVAMQSAQTRAESVIEAQGWYRDPDGTVVLTAQPGMGRPGDVKMVQCVMTPRDEPQPGNERFRSGKM